MSMSGARALVKALEREGVKHMFGIIGGSIMPVFDELLDSNIRHITTRHEQSAAHAADGYARVSGKPGVAITTSGPGATNLVTGIATAYMDSSPIVAITGQVPTYMIGKMAFQETDIINITKPITKWNYQIRKPEEVPKAVKKAFTIAMLGRPGPTLLDFPKDVQTGEGEVEFDVDISQEINPWKPPKLDACPEEVKKAVDMILSAERPVFIVGGGVIWSGATDEVLAIAEYLLIPIMATFMGKGAVPENHPLYVGNLGMHGRIAANKLLPETDLIIAVGMRWSDRTVSEFENFAPDAKIIHIDIDPREVGKNVKVDLGIIGDAKRVLRSIYEEIKRRVRKRESWPWLQKVKEFKEKYREELVPIDGNYLRPPEILKELRKILPPDTIVATEVGQNQMWVALYFPILKPRTFLTSGGLGTMGFGFPAAIGAKVAKPERIVIDIAGDGSFMMSERELATAVNEDIPVIVVIFNNSSLGMVAQWQRMFYNRRYIATYYKKNPDFAKLAEVYGAQGFRAETMDELIKAVKEGMKSEVPTVIDVPIHPEDDVLPMVPPGEHISKVVTRY
ncbi:acetolactate synthase, large subunit [Pyrococcus sp. NA2]|uniref:biosynthetic-type acetolactate synthase large subunit n=1 Tax=Pyrococcus sp. (strain NA2) TaxID=342949 RepID=UPI000209AE09|nr:biosynthetic-type acetolactate synthase large subunit [Pyrococcus sp. NA2]AEC52261.1 acetolactate synthase, large subunit [Pyrococcus sp. NA2]